MMKLNEKCDTCKLKCTKEHKIGDGDYVDPCLGILPGVKYACCGHGGESGYVFFENGLVVRFSELISSQYYRYSKYHDFGR